MGLWRDFSGDKLLAPCGRPRVEAGEYTIIDIFPKIKAGGFPPSRVSFPASQEVAQLAIEKMETGGSIPLSYRFFNPSAAYTAPTRIYLSASPAVGSQF